MSPDAECLLAFQLPLNGKPEFHITSFEPTVLYPDFVGTFKNVVAFIQICRRHLVFVCHVTDPAPQRGR